MIQILFTVLALVGTPTNAQEAATFNEVAVAMIPAKILGKGYFAQQEASFLDLRAGKINKTLSAMCNYELESMNPWRDGNRAYTMKFTHNKGSFSQTFLSTDMVQKKQIDAFTVYTLEIRPHRGPVRVQRYSFYLQDQRVKAVELQVLACDEHQTCDWVSAGCEPRTLSDLLPN